MKILLALVPLALPLSTVPAQQGGAFDPNAWQGLAQTRSGPYVQRRAFRYSVEGRAWSRRFRIVAAMQWLQRTQNEDGSFGGEGKAPLHDVGLTAIGELVFLGYGSTMRSGPFKNEIKRAAKWLRSLRGNDGLYSTAATAGSLLDHTLATLAMTEAYGLSSYKTLKKDAVLGADHLRQGMPSDPRVLGFELLLHRALGNFALEGLANHVATTSKAVLTVGVDPSKKRGMRRPVAMLLGTVGPGARPALLNRPTPDTAMLLAAVGRDLAKSADDDMLLYLGTLAMHAQGGPDADLWLEKLHAFAAKTQEKDGSWPPRGGATGKVGRIYSTAMMLLLLQSRFDGRVPRAADAVAAKPADEQTEKGSEKKSNKQPGK